MSFIRLLSSFSRQNIRNFNLSSIDTQRIVVQYSNGHEYKNQFMGLEQVLKRKFPSVNVIGEPSKEKDESFEVTVDNVVVHSKLKGDGFVDEDLKMKKITDAVSRVAGGERAEPPKSPFETPIN